MFSISTNSKRIWAGLLLGLFSFILAEKNAHSHTEGDIAKVHKEQASVQTDTSCLICDFKLAADADIPVQLTTDTPPQHMNGYNLPVSSFYYSSFSSALSDRGPPTS